MRIGVILDGPFPPDPRVENEALSLISAGHEVYLFSINFSGINNEENYRGIHVVRYSAPHIIYKLSALVFSLPFYTWYVSRLIKTFITSKSVQALHVHDMVIAEAAMAANRSFTLPLVLDLHENRPEIMKQYKHVNSFSGKLLINLKHWSAKYYQLSKKAPYVVVVTKAAKDDIVEQTKVNPDKIIVVPNTVHAESFLSSKLLPDVRQKMEGTFNLLYIGDTSLRRGTDTAIEALAFIKHKIPNVRLWLIGRSSADTSLRALTFKFQVVDLVKFEGWQDPSTFLSYLSKSHVALSPIKRNKHHDTTYANKIFQYMTAGVPVIVSDCTAQADLVSSEGCGLVHKADDARDLAEKIIYMYENSGEAEEMSTKGKRAVSERWNWNKTINPLIEVYGRLM